MPQLLALLIAASPGVEVRIESNRRVDLVRLEKAGERPYRFFGDTVPLEVLEKHTLCRSPCRQPIDPLGSELVIARAGVVPSDPFRIGHRTHAVLEVHAGSTRVRTASIFVLLGAVIAGVAGLTSLVVDLASPPARVGPFTIGALLSYGALAALGGALFGLSETSVIVR